MAKMRDAAAAVADPPRSLPEAAPAVAPPASDAPMCPYHPETRTKREQPVRSVLRRYHCPMAGCLFSIDLPPVEMHRARSVEVNVPMPR